MWEVMEYPSVTRIEKRHSQKSDQIPEAVKPRHEMVLAVISVADIQWVTEWTPSRWEEDRLLEVGGCYYRK